MKFAVEQWQPEYGAPVEGLDLEEEAKSVDLEVESGAANWAGISPVATMAIGSLLFVDGVRRIESRIWLQNDASLQMGICASCAAGVVRCDGTAWVEQAITRRLVIAPRLTEGIITKHAHYEPRVVIDDRMESLMNALAQALSSLEVEAAEAAGESALTVLDGPLRGRERIRGAIGYIKSHRVAYLPVELSQVVANLAAGQRTPVFLVETSWTRYSWYLRLPGGTGHPWAGIVRCEAPPVLSKYQAIDVANAVAATLPRYASEPRKDGRAPQNLYPISGLEGYLRRRLGDAAFLYRSIKRAAAS